MESGRSALAAGTRPHARGCVKTPAFNLRVESSSHLVNLKTKSSGDGCSKKAIEKAVLRFLGSRTFSHGLDPKLPFAAHERWAARGLTAIFSRSLWALALCNQFL